MLTASVCLASASCPYMGSSQEAQPVFKRDDAENTIPTWTDEFMAKFEVDDSDTYLTNSFGVPISDQESLRVGDRGPTLLEDFIFREKIMHFGQY